ncbi:hypothetical protein LguiB_020942 [Lonicera macranthoides]
MQTPSGFQVVRSQAKAKTIKEALMAMVQEMMSKAEAWRRLRRIVNKNGRHCLSKCLMEAQEIKGPDGGVALHAQGKESARMDWVEVPPSSTSRDSKWEESLKRPGNILFLNYDDMKRDPKGQVKKLASFLGRPFEKDEDVEKIVWRCSFERLNNLEVNKSGLEPWFGIPKSSYFWLGVVGDWKNSLSLEMK